MEEEVVPLGAHSARSQMNAPALSPAGGRRVIPRPAQRQKQLCVSMDRDTMREIDEAAKSTNLTRSEWVRERLEWALMGDDA
jgi:hypothetical protein